MVKFSVSTWIYGEEPLETSMERLHRFGYDGVEIVGEPKKLSANQIKELLKCYNLEASSICGIYNQERDLVSSNSEIRRNAIQYVKECSKLCREIDAPLVIVVPSAINKRGPEAHLEKEWEWAVEGIREAGEYAADLNVMLAIEPINRFETYLVNKVEQAIKLAEDVDLDNVQIMADCFHMNIEESSTIDKAIFNAKEKLIHIHVCDNNRLPPGKGHIDFKSIIRILKEINYDKYLTMEFLPSSADTYHALKGVRDKNFYEDYTRDSISYMKRIWQETAL